MCSRNQEKTRTNSDDYESFLAMSITLDVIDYFHRCVDIRICITYHPEETTIQDRPVLDHRVVWMMMLFLRNRTSEQSIRINHSRTIIIFITIKRKNRCLIRLSIQFTHFILFTNMTIDTTNENKGKYSGE